MANRKLNLGSGEFPKQGFVNVDSEAHVRPDTVHNLDTFPYPFPDNEFELVEADHVLEHLNHPFATMKEIYRVLVPGGRATIRVPHFSRGFTHADHKRGFDVTFPYYFRRDFKGGYTGVEFELVRMRLTWFAQPYLKKQILSAPVFWGMTVVGAIIDALANLSPALCSRIWCYWVGGFEQIEYEFRKPNN